MISDQYIDIDSNGGPAQVGVQVQVVSFNPLARMFGWGLLVIGLLGMLVLMTALIWWGTRLPPAPAAVTVVPTPPPLKPTAAPAVLTVLTPKPTFVPAVTVVPTAETATLAPVPVVSTPTPLPTAQPTRTPTDLPNPTAALVRLCPNPGVRITSPLSGESLRGTIQVQGAANIDRFSYYKIELRPEGGPTWSFLMRFDQPVTDGVLMTWDTMTVPPGSHRLRLVVVDETGNYPEPCEIWVVVRR